MFRILEARCLCLQYFVFKMYSFILFKNCYNIFTIILWYLVNMFIYGFNNSFSFFFNISKNHWNKLLNEYNIDS